MPKSHIWQTWDSNPGPEETVKTEVKTSLKCLAPAGSQMQSSGAAASHPGETVWEEPLADLTTPRALSGHNSQEAVSLCHPQQRLKREFTLHLPHSLAWRSVQVYDQTLG